MTATDALKPCPCGQTPPGFCLEAVGMKYANASPNCCNEWGFEFRINYETDPQVIERIAAESWNALPRRASPISEETMETVREYVNRNGAYRDINTAMHLLRRVLEELSP